jgi:hypothetical protein
MHHGYDDYGKLKEPPLLKTIGLTAIGRPYHFQGTLRDIKKFMEGRGSTIGLRVSILPDTALKHHTWHYLVVDITDVAGSAAEAYQKAVVAAIPGVNILGALAGVLRRKKVIMKLRYGFTAPPQTRSHARVHIELPENGSNLGHLAAALDGSRKVTGLKVANVGVSVAKTVLKILTKGLSIA